MSCGFRSRWERSSTCVALDFVFRENVPLCSDLDLLLSPLQRHENEPDNENSTFTYFASSYTIHSRVSPDRQGLLGSPFVRDSPVTFVHRGGNGNTHVCRTDPRFYLAPTDNKGNVTRLVLLGSLEKVRNVVWRYSVGYSHLFAGCRLFRFERGLTAGRMKHHPIVFMHF